MECCLSCGSPLIPRAPQLRISLKGSRVNRLLSLISRLGTRVDGGFGVAGKFDLLVWPWIRSHGHEPHRSRYPRKAACSGPARHFALIEDPREARRVAHPLTRIWCPASFIEFLPFLGPMANLFPDALGFVTLWYLVRNWRSRRVKMARIANRERYAQTERSHPHWRWQRVELGVTLYALCNRLRASRAVAGIEPAPVVCAAFRRRTSRAALGQLSLRIG